MSNYYYLPVKQASHGFRRLTGQVPSHQLQYELTGNIQILRAQFHDHKIFHRLGNYPHTCSYTCIGQVAILLIYVKNYWQGQTIIRIQDSKKEHAFSQPSKFPDTNLQTPPLPQPKECCTTQPRIKLLDLRTYSLEFLVGTFIELCCQGKPMPCPTTQLNTVQKLL